MREQFFPNKNDHGDPALQMALDARRDAIWQQLEKKQPPKTGIASASTERLMCGALSPSTFARRGMNGSIEDAIRLVYLGWPIDQDRFAFWS